MIFYKQICLLLCLALTIATKTLCQNHKTDSLPQPVGFVNDFEDIFSTTQENYLDSMIRAYEEKTTIQIALITVDSSMTSRRDFDNYILQIANAWGVGKKGKDNGITIGISKGYRTMRIQNGYGIESVLSDIETKNIIDTAFILPFKRGEYFEGVANGLKAIMNKLH
ncbi:MAG: TPM domain-containing protein [Bacteroidota bacterium]